jgi:hypothetical protein
MTPWDVGVEWLTGLGPARRDFIEGDFMVRKLREHDHINDTKEIISAELSARCFTCRAKPYRMSNPYSLAGYQGILKYMKDYSTLGTAGMTGNLVVTYLGSYSLRVHVTNIACREGTAQAVMYVDNTSSLASGTRPPVIGYTKWYTKYISPFINAQTARIPTLPMATRRPMSPTRQTLTWNEQVHFPANECCY